MNKVSKILIAVLLISNITALGALWALHHNCGGGRPPVGNAPGGKTGIELLAEDLNFSPEQVKQLKELREAHFKKAKVLEQTMQETRRALHQLIKDPDVTQETIDSMATAIGNAHRDMEMLVFQHFMDIKGICTEAQQKQFDETLDKILRQMGPPQGPPDGPPGGRPGMPPGGGMQPPPPGRP